MSNQFDKNEHEEETKETTDSKSTVETNITLANHDAQGTVLSPFKNQLAGTIPGILASHSVVDTNPLTNAVIFANPFEDARISIQALLGTALSLLQDQLADTMPGILASHSVADTSPLIAAGVFTNVLDERMSPIQNLLGTTLAPLQNHLADAMSGILASHSVADTSPLIAAGVFTNVLDERMSPIQNLLGTTLAPLQNHLAGAMQGLIVPVQFDEMFPDPHPIVASSLGESLNIIGAGVFEEISTGVFSSVDRMSALTGSALEYIVVETPEIAGSQQTDVESERFILLDSDFIDFWGRGILLMAIYDIGKEVVKLILKHV